MGDKADYVRSQGQTRNHECHWPDCKVQVPPAMFMCKGHWFTLPKDLQRKIWQEYRIGQEADMKPSEEYLAVADAVQKWIANHPTFKDADKQGKLF